MMTGGSQTTLAEVARVLAVRVDLEADELPD